MTAQNAFGDPALTGPIWSLEYSAPQSPEYSVSQKKIPPEDLWQFFQNGREFFNHILHAYYAFQSTLDYEFLFSYMQL